MKKVVLFKGESEEWASAFGAAQYDAVFVPPLRFEPVASGVTRLAGALREVRHDALALTSPRAAEALARAAGPAALAAWRERPLYVVGEATAAACRALGLSPRGAAAGSARALADLMVAERAPGSTVLFPCGNLRSETLVDILHSKGMVVEALTVYETKENDQLKQNLMELSSAEGTPCCMVFFSPSGCEYIHRQLQTFNNSLSFLPHFAIGNSTAHKIENLGVEPAGVAATPRPADMLDALRNYFSALEEA